MEQEQVILTAEGIRRLEQELEELKTVRRREVAERIKVARGFGDLSENAEYEAAKNEQAFVEGRIASLEKMLRNAQMVDEASVDPDVVNVGSLVEVEDLESGDRMELHIVGSSEADPGRSAISYQSPVGRALMGGRAGATVEVRLPDGHARFRILAVRRQA
ncbi:MAG: transcription elongation factor GreA [Clostridia bacterium]|nr:transcription elongation factor GreA [Clostridia bacterium]MCL6521214.1 transcription elongation factor GreA [Bacillota bacterium]